MRTTLCIHACLGMILTVTSFCAGQDQVEPIRVGIEEHLGETLDLDTLSFIDEDGQPVSLKPLFDKPVVLTLVYYRCPGICTPLLQELTRVMDLCDLVPGEDYRLLTISFDPKETPKLARNKQRNMLATLTKKSVSPEDWRFFTGDEENIRAITEAVGFRYIPDRNKVDFVHAATIMFLATDGKIARYLNGTQFNPADLKLAVIDASEGRARSFMQRIQKLCYSYDPEGRSYVLKVNRIILGATFVFAIGFGAFLLFKGGSGRRPGGRRLADEHPSSQTTGDAS